MKRIKPFGGFRTLFLCFTFLFTFTTISCNKDEPTLPANYPPVLESSTSVVAYADSLFRLELMVSDPNNDPVTIKVNDLPAWLDFDAPNKVLEGTPSREDEGDYTLQLDIDDGFSSVSREVNISVIVIIGISEKLESELTTLYTQETMGMSGVSVAVYTPEGETLLSTRGNVNGWQNVPMGSQHRFRVASVTKHFTAALILRLSEEGYLSLDDKLSDHLVIDGLAYNDQMTIRHLLSNTAGLVDHLNSSAFWDAYPNWETREWEPEEIYQYAIDQGPISSPGLVYSYSNTGFFILGEMIEAIMGQPLAEVFDEWLIDPLELTNTLYDVVSTPITPIENMAKNNRTYEYRLSVVGAAGAMVSTPGDLVKFGRALYNGAYISQELVQEMWTDIGSAAGGDMYGLGTRLWDDNNVDHLGHTGSLMDYRSILMYVPEHNLTISLATNDPHSNWYDLVNGILVEMVNHYR